MAAGWTALAQWARQQAHARAAVLTEAQAAKEATADQYRKLAAEFGEAERALARLREEARTASENDQRARARLGQVSARIGELDALLDGTPNDEQITERLALLKRLETAADQAKSILNAARQRRIAADKALAALRDEEQKARAQLSAARDSVVALGAPVLDGRGLLDAWMVLLTWGQDETKVREQEAATAERATDVARASIVELTSQLSRDLANSGIELASGAVHEKAAAAVASALEGARARTSRIKERRAEAADLVQKQRTAQEEQQVAHMLGNLLQARQFPQWLVSEALDDLVTAASETLAALTNGQFDLTHDKGDLFVIDHADADARRSVRTLSGGETFQASLALALALSSQISALAAAGAARLDSIFLDEGFGTLDGETLEVVATTLETLAQGSRMVGVVTHVTALAERVPVRYRVTRNARTLTVARAGPRHRGRGGAHGMISDVAPPAAETGPTGQPMRFAVDGWDPSYGASLELEEQLQESTATVAVDVELPASRWQAIDATTDRALPGAILFVDGVRRIEARVWIDDEVSDGARSSDAQQPARLVRGGRGVLLWRAGASGDGGDASRSVLGRAPRERHRHPGWPLSGALHRERFGRRPAYGATFSGTAASPGRGRDGHRRRGALVSA